MCVLGMFMMFFARVQWTFGDNCFVNKSAHCALVLMYTRSRVLSTVTSSLINLRGTSMCLTLLCWQGFSIHFMHGRLSSYTVMAACDQAYQLHERGRILYPGVVASVLHECIHRVRAALSQRTSEQLWTVSELPMRWRHYFS